MELQQIHQFSSKRNQVILARCTTAPNQAVVVKNFGENLDSLNTELRVMNLFSQSNVPVPQILQCTGEQIVYEHIDGEILLNLLEKLEKNPADPSVYAVFDSLCQWLATCYLILQQAFGKTMILSDIHLRNFIYRETVYGVDFECVQEGKIEEDIARLLAFTMTYAPQFTPAKISLATYLYEKCTSYLKLDCNFLLAEIEHQLQFIASRRNVTYDKNTISAVLKQLNNLPK